MKSLACRWKRFLAGNKLRYSKKNRSATSASYRILRRIKQKSSFKMQQKTMVGKQLKRKLNKSQGIGQRDGRNVQKVQKESPTERLDQASKYSQLELSPSTRPFDRLLLEAILPNMLSHQVDKMRTCSSFFNNYIEKNRASFPGKTVFSLLLSEGDSGKIHVCMREQLYLPPVERNMEKSELRGRLNRLSPRVIWLNWSYFKFLDLVWLNKIHCVNVHFDQKLGIDGFRFSNCRGLIINHTAQVEEIFEQVTYFATIHIHAPSVPLDFWIKLIEKINSGPGLEFILVREECNTDWRNLIHFFKNVLYKQFTEEDRKKRNSHGGSILIKRINCERAQFVDSLIKTNKFATVENRGRRIIMTTADLRFNVESKFLDD